MTLLWARVAAFSSYAEDHEEHSMNPAFEAAGIKHSPCAFSLCNHVDWDHADDFDEAESRALDERHELPVERISLKEPLYGFEHTADMHTLRRYTKHPESRNGLPLVFRSQGKHHILNGHHGLAAALRRGDSHADVHMIDLDQGD